PALLLLGSAVALVLLRAAHHRFRHRRVAQGLGVLAHPRLRNRLILLVLALTLAALLRTWIVLVGFGLPTDPADAALLLVSMGAIGLLPLGLGTAPTATVVAMGAADLSSAAAAGLVLSASTMLAVLLYAGACWACGARFTTTAQEGRVVPAEVVPLPLPASP